MENKNYLFESPRQTKFNELLITSCLSSFNIMCKIHIINKVKKGTSTNTGQLTTDCRFCMKWYTEVQNNAF